MVCCQIEEDSYSDHILFALIYYPLPKNGFVSVKVKEDDMFLKCKKGSRMRSDQVQLLRFCFRSDVVEMKQKIHTLFD
jgi:hypothetical protein